MTTLTFSCFFVMKNIRRICFISTLSRCMVVIGLLLTLRIGVTQTEETSKACYGAPGLRCVSHHLNCVNGTIAIREAYYTDNTQCGATGQSSCNVKVDNITDTGNHNAFNAAEWDILQRNCSSQAKCEFIAGRRNLMVFSVVKYNCIQNTFDVCSAIHNQQSSDPSLIWKGNGSIGQEERTCSCSFCAKGNDVNVNITSLDIRMYTNQTVCMAMTIITDDDVVDVNCSSWIRPYHVLAHATHVQHVVIVITQPSIPGQIWIQIQASTQLSLHCPPNESSSTVTDGASTISSTNTHVTDTTQFRGHRKSTTVSEGVVSNSENGLPTQSYTTLYTSSLGTTEPLIINAKDGGVSPGVLAGALVPFVLIIAGILLFIVYFMRKRNKDMREKENKKTLPKSSEVYSLATTIPENIYLELENQPTVSTDYDYATADGFENSTKPYRNNDANGKPQPSQLRVHQVKEGDYDHIGDKQSFQNSDYDTAASVAHTVHQTVKPSSLSRDGDVYSYDHLNEPTNIDGAERDVGTHSAEYDTAASSRIEAAKLNSKSSNVKENDYGYNHLGSNHQVKTIQNEYDTSASAVKAVAALGDTGATEENDYDHVDKNTGSKTPTSPYDTARNVRDHGDEYSLAGTVTNPYDMAK